MAVQRLQAESSSRDFLRWRHYIDWDFNHHTKRDWYFAAIIAEIARVLHPRPWLIKTKNKLLQFEKETPPEELSPEEEKEKALEHKNVLLSVMGLFKRNK